jgi:DNA polymerase III delta prime subunit
MTNASRHRPTASSQPWWIRFSHWLQRGLGFTWIAIIIAVIVNIMSSRLASDKDFPPDSPVGWMIHHLVIVVTFGMLLLMLTLLVGIVSHRYPTHTSHASSSLPMPTQQSRNTFVSALRQEYTMRLAHSSQGAAIMALGLHERTDITRSSAQLVFHRSEAPAEHLLPPGTSIVQVFDDAGQGLLILGEPGAGKTTLLLDLARELLIRAEGNPTHPLPVILNLSSWASKKPMLATWLIDQLQLVYGVPTRLGQAWLEQDQWLLLLDGLDEVSSAVRADCIEAINTYRGQHFVPLVVCSRNHEYLAQETQLALPIAVVVQPLQEQQVTDYLKHMGEPMAAVQAALHTNTRLKQLITTPLMLSMVILTYRDKAVSDLLHLESVEEQQQQIFDHYIQRMLEQRATRGYFTTQQILQWLTWLAQQMKQHDLTEFYLEHLQPTWLPTKRSQTSYILIGGLVAGLVIGLFAGLTIGLIVGLFAGLDSGLFVGLLLGPTIGLFVGLLFRRRSMVSPTDVLTWSWKSFWKELPSVLFGKLGNVLFSLLSLGVVGGMLGGMLGGPVRGLSISLLIVLFGVLVTGLVGGLSGVEITEHLRIKPNQGIRSSGWNALRIGLITILIFGLPGVLFGVLVFGSVFESVIGLVSGLVFGWVFGLVFGSVGVLQFGGEAYLCHYILRYILWRSGAMPWHYIRFLEEATERILLQRVGGGYRFIHPLFLDYFASGTVTPSGRGEPSPPQ